MQRKVTKRTRNKEDSKDDEDAKTIFAFKRRILDSKTFFKIFIFKLFILKTFLLWEKFWKSQALDDLTVTVFSLFFIKRKRFFLLFLYLFFQIADAQTTQWTTEVKKKKRILWEMIFAIFVEILPSCRKYSWNNETAIKDATLDH